MTNSAAAPARIALLTHASNDLTVLQQAQAQLPDGFGAVAGVNLQALESDASEASGSTVLLLETAQESLPENKTLTFYRRGCGVMAMLFTTVLCGKRRYW